MFRKYFLSRTLFPPLLSAPVGTTEILASGSLELDDGCSTGGFPWQALTLDECVSNYYPENRRKGPHLRTSPQANNDLASCSSTTLLPTYT